MKKNFGNSKAVSFLNSFNDLVSLEDEKCNIAGRSKFNFSFFNTSQDNSGSVNDWDKKTICDFFNKLVEYSKSSLDELCQVGIGKKRNGLLTFYQCFPKHSLFEHPKSIPHQAVWGRFRLDSDKRLIGFVVPQSFHGVPHKASGIQYDKNTFYVVFIDNHHKFYPMS